LVSISTIDISKRIAEPNSILHKEIEGFEKLSKDYPYTQIFSLLFLKGLKLHKDVRFEDELKKHSFRISNRNMLYDIVHTEYALEPTIEEGIEELEIVEPVSNEGTSIEESNNDPKEQVQHEETVIPQEIIIEPIITEVIEVEENRSEITSIETIASTIDIETTPIVEINIPEQKIALQTSSNDALDESILHHSYAANYHLNDLTEEEAKKIEEKKNKIEEKIKTKKFIVSEVKTEEKPSSFTSWLKADSNYEEHESEQFGSPINTSEELLFGEVVKPKKEFFSPIKKAKESLQENTIPVSETLAKIFDLQGNYPKAISAYEQLSLNYPEKKIFFANQIKRIKKKINSK